MKTMTKGVALATVSACLYVGTPAFAQEVSAETAGEQLEEIVVTAQKRSESAQNVPIALTAVSNTAIQAAKIDTLGALTRGIVGIQYDSSSTQRNELYIRGIGTNRFDIGSDPSSGVYIDEIYQPRFADVLTGLLDVERIEVLRGPQGTLFGRNTIGGAISIFSAEPTQDLTARITAGYGNRDLYEAGATVSGAVSSRIRARLTGSYRNRSGFMQDTVSGRDNGIETYSIRAKIVADITDRATLHVTGAYFNSKQDALLGDPLSLPLFLAGPLTPQRLDNAPFSGAYTFPGGNTIRNGQVNAKLVLDGDDVAFTAIASWISFRQRPSQDLDGAPNDIMNYFGRVNSNTYSGELRFSSQDGGSASFGDRVKWVAGLYYFSDNARERNDFTIGRDSILSFLLANPKCATRATCLPPFANPTVRYTDSSDVRSHLQSIAAYFQASIVLFQPLSLTIGARYTSDQRQFTFSADGSIPGFPPVPADFVVKGKPTSTSFDPRVALEYRPASGVLVYGSWSQGFKSGSIQSTAPTAAIASLVTRPERVDAFEIGVKSELFDRKLRLNLSAFRNEFKDLQVRRVIVLQGNPTAIAENAATSTIEGVEVEGSVLPAAGLRIDASYAYLKGRYDRYVVGAGLDFSGNEMPRAPRNRFNIAATYETAFAMDTKLELRASYNWTGSFYFQPANLAVEKEPSYGLTDLSLRLTLPNKATAVQVWGRNVFNRTYRTYLDPLDAERIAAYGDRATYGISLAHSF